ncbi:MAG: hypothetical protein WA418_21645, partial [Bradyrhizobium sp.]
HYACHKRIVAQMSRSTKLFGLIAKTLPGVVLCKDMLVVPPTGHILRGFLLETTMVRDMVYLWRVVTPLHRPMRHPFLDYSTRIQKGEPVYINRHAYGESADRVRAIITDGHIEFLQQIRDPSDFLRHVTWMIGNPSILFQIDLAFTYHLVGNVRDSADILRALDVEVDRLPPRQQEYVHPLVKRAVREMERSPAALTALLNEWENQNIDALGLQASRTAPPLGGVESAKRDMPSEH